MADPRPVSGTEFGTEVLPGDDGGIVRAARALRGGELVAFPTETVYGLGADARSSAAVGAVYAAKGRPAGDPLIVHVADIETAASLGELGDAGGHGRRLAAAFWPGPLTMVVPRLGGVAPEVGLGGTVGLRCPAHPVARALIREAGFPIAAPSANRFGRVSPTEVAHVLAELGGRIPWVLDGGPTPLGVESTVVSVNGSTIRLLRPGGVPVEDLVEELGEGMVEVPEAARISAAEVAPGPGMNVSHYVPSIPLVLTDAGPEVAEEIATALEERGITTTVLRLAAGDLAAAELYSRLRGLESEPARVAVTTTIDPTGLGRAVNDRLFRAAHGHVATDAESDSIDRIQRRLDA